MGKAYVGRNVCTYIMILFFCMILFSSCGKTESGIQNEKTDGGQETGRTYPISNQVSILCNYRFGWLKELEEPNIWYVDSEELSLPFEFESSGEDTAYGLSIFIDGKPVEYYLVGEDGVRLNQEQEYLVPFEMKPGDRKKFTLLISVPSAKQGTEYNMYVNIIENIKSGESAAEDLASNTFQGNGLYRLHYNTTVHGAEPEEARYGESTEKEIPENLSAQLKRSYGESALTERTCVFLADASGAADGNIECSGSLLSLRCELVGGQAEEYMIYLFIDGEPARIDGHGSWKIRTQPAQMTVWEFSADVSNLEDGSSVYCVAVPCSPYYLQYEGEHSEPAASVCRFLYQEQ